MSKKILIIGGGTAGIMAAAKLKKTISNFDITIFDPASVHYYQSARTLVGAGTYKFEDTGRPLASLVPSGVKLIKEAIKSFKPENNQIICESGDSHDYDYLIVCPGIKYDLSLIEGLSEALDKGVVCSNYTDPQHTWEVLKNCKGGNAIFTQPTTPIKCGGAPQKIAYLAADYFRKNNINANVVLAMPGGVIFAVKEIAKTLMEVVKNYGIHFKPFYAPVKIDAKNKIITFKLVNAGDNNCVINEDKTISEKLKGPDLMEMQFDMLHLAPPQTAPDFIKKSTLVSSTGWLEVDIKTLQHKKFDNIFGLGDVCDLPTAKTGSAVRRQVPIVVNNILKHIKDGSVTSVEYDGYSACPLVTGYGKMVLAEFDYDLNFTPDPKLKQMLVFNSDKEHWRLWILKKYILPYLYWNKMLKGVDV